MRPAKTMTACSQHLCEENRAMHCDEIRRWLFVGATCLLAIPWLTPCSNGETKGPGTPYLDRTGGTWGNLPNDQLKEWARKPGPQLRVVSHTSLFSKQLLVSDAELSAATGGAQASRPKAGLGFRFGQAVSSLTTMPLNLYYPMIKGLAGSDRELVEPMKPKQDNARRQLVVCENPFVLLQGEDLVFFKSGNPESIAMARASTGAKVTVITPDGTFFGIARRIHFRRGQQEILLEGDPTVVSGHQYIKGGKPDAMMSLDFKERVVIVSGQAAVKKLFY